MLELSSLKKQKVNLEDYDWLSDAKNRMAMSDFSTFDVEVLEEIVYSSLKFSTHKLATNLSCLLPDLNCSLDKFSQIGLLRVEGDTVFVDKEKRKYFEFEMNRFDPQFKPDMEFLQGLLKKVPIHLLPSWYAIPRTSNNIFESIVEKYLLTPQVYQRYLLELSPEDPVVRSVFEDVMSAPDFKVSSSDLISKYNLSREHFEKIILSLEFHFTCSLFYEKQEDHWIEYVTLFHEWKEYLLFLKNTEPLPISNPEKVELDHSSETFFIEEMSQILAQALKGPISLESTKALRKLVLVGLARYENKELIAQEGALSWLESPVEDRALYLYRHPQNTIEGLEIGDRYLREAERSVKRVLHGQFVYLEEFLKGVLIPLSENSVISLIRIGKQWQYKLPQYDEREKAIIETTIFEWLSELGMVQTGSLDGKKCFRLTPFGKFLFSD